MKPQKPEKDKLKSLIILVEKAVNGQPYLYEISNSGKELVIGTLKKYESDQFLRVNRNTVINKEMITAINGRKVRLENNREFKISRRKLHQFI